MSYTPKTIASKAFTAELYLEGSWGARDVGKHDSTMTLYDTNERNCFGIEWDIPGLDRTEVIGIWIDVDTREITDYDGVFSLPAEAIALLEEAGFVVPEDFR